jgi:hypothetical protein
MRPWYSVLWLPSAAFKMNALSGMHIAARQEAVSNEVTPWWEAPWFMILCMFLIAAPLIWPDIPGLTDLPGHLGRYKIAVSLQHSEDLRRFYEFEWALVPNLGVDLIVVALSRFIDVELAVKLIALMTPPLTLLGFLLVAREAHGRISPTYLFAAPLILGYPFQYGFLNFTLSVAFAFLALGLWLRLGRSGRIGLRAALFVPLSLAVWLVQAFGWGILGLLAFASEITRQLDLNRAFPKAAVLAVYRCSPLVAPLALTLAWQSGNAEAATGDWFNIAWKLTALLNSLRDRWIFLDLGSICLLLFFIYCGARDHKLAYARSLALGAILLLLAVLFLPRILLGGAHVDSRLAPYVLAVAILGIRPSLTGSYRFANLLALTGLGFFLVRVGSNVTSLWLYDRSYDAELRVLDYIPKGARVAAFVGAECHPRWATSRLEHLPGMAIVRKDAFSNDQWTVSGSHLLHVRSPWTHFVDPSQFVTAQPCDKEKWQTIEEALTRLPRENFDYVWLVNPPPYEAALTSSWRAIWAQGTSALFELHHTNPERRTEVRIP